MSYSLIIKDCKIFSNTVNLDIPDYLCEDDTNIYQMKEFVKSKLNNITKDTVFKFSSDINDNDIFDFEKIIKVDVTTEIPIIPINLKTGNSVPYVITNANCDEINAVNEVIKNSQDVIMNLMIIYQNYVTFLLWIQ